MKRLSPINNIIDNKNRSRFNACLIILPIIGALVAVIFFDWILQRVVIKDSHNQSVINIESFELVIIVLLSSALVFSLVMYLFTSLKNKKIVKFAAIDDQTSKDELLSLASHQLRTPATAVKQYLGMILQGYAGDISDEQFDLLNKAYISNERQLETINQILYVTKADTGRLQLQKSYFNLNQLVEEVITDLAASIKNRGQKIDFKPKYINMTIFADKHCMRMVVENLLTNASKYTHKGGNIVVITDKKSGIAILSVEDNGVGISFEDRTKLFKKFSRVDNELSIQAGGSGIGLYLDKILVELHGGHIRVVSQPNKGTLFSVHLPLLQTKSAKLVAAR